MDLHDLNKACPKDNLPTSFIDQIVNERAGCEVFSFMDGFSKYNQIQIKPEDQHKTNFICPWGTFTYRKIPFGLKKCWSHLSTGHVIHFSRPQTHSRGVP
jgi:hypothetical protein